MLDIEQLRAEVLKRHNVAIGRDDPILMTVTLNELVLGEFFRRIDEAAAAAERRGASEMTQQLQAVKSTAERMIVGASQVISEEVQRAGKAVADNLDARLASAERSTLTAAWSGRLSILGAIVSIGAAMLTVGVALGALFR
ncbi:MAG: hypothetical protein J0L91_00070 [Burkholderiales bacterium]|nr:hypothetical protein [Burkholderiales bacterium]